MVIIYLATKWLAALALAVAESRRWLDHDEKVASYWPAFAQRGKQDITVRQRPAWRSHALTVLPG